MVPTGTSPGSTTRSPLRGIAGLLQAGHVWPESNGANPRIAAVAMSARIGAVAVIPHLPVF